LKLIVFLFFRVIHLGNEPAVLICFKLFQACAQKSKLLTIILSGRSCLTGVWWSKRIMPLRDWITPSTLRRRVWASTDCWTLRVWPPPFFFLFTLAFEVVLSNTDRVFF